MKALLVTGTLAEATVKQYANQSHTQTQVLALNTPVAAFLTPQTIIQTLQQTPLKNIDLILTPGQMPHNTQPITDALHIPTYKGPRYAADLPVVLDALGKVTLSTVVPACDLMREKVKEAALQELKKTETNKETLLQTPGNLTVKDVALGKAFPMRVLAEIADAPLLETQKIAQLAKQYVASGANIIDLGMVAGQTRPSDAKRAVEAVKAAVGVPVSIDTLNPVEVEAAVAAGADLILSADEGNLEAIAPFARDTAVVVIPTNQRRGYFPQTPRERVELLERLIAHAQELGFKKIIGDLILEPTKILDSYVAFREFAHRNPNVPLMIGIANVVELFDADSVGLNALLTRLSAEVGADILLVTEETPKTRGSIKEASTAAKMMFLAKKRDSVPRDLGLDLLILKDKIDRESPLRLDVKNAVTAQTHETAPFVSDPCGVFRVLVDHQGGMLVAAHYASGDTSEPLHVIRGGSAEAVLGEILRCGLVSRLDHAGYLGVELAKAEVALRVGKSYVQDEVLFR
ncbi:MAG: dihydropteroate synthase-like protein [Candidatus Bathyarchaeota archaeon]|nr:dihydropteroate synthase-like protein [Candidatus Bathyarchaeota archaeon]